MSLLTSGIQHNELAHNTFTRVNRFDRPLLFTMGDHFTITKSTGKTIVYDNQDDTKTIFKVDQANTEISYGEDETIELNLGNISVRDNFIVKSYIRNDDEEIPYVLTNLLNVRMNSLYTEAITTVYGDFGIYEGLDDDSDRIFFVNQSSGTVRFYNSNDNLILDIDGRDDDDDNAEDEVHAEAEMRIEKQFRSSTLTNVSVVEGAIDINVSNGQVFKYSGGSNANITLSNLEESNKVFFIVHNDSSTASNITFTFSSDFAMENNTQVILNGQTNVFSFVAINGIVGGIKLYQIFKPAVNVMA
jgi:hypothetical protein